jgi:hypothetical protein
MKKPSQTSEHTLQATGSPILQQEIAFHQRRLAQAKEESIKQFARCIDATLLTAGGSALIWLSYNAQFVMLISVNLPPIALTLGVLLLGVGLYQAYSAYPQSRPTVTPTSVVRPPQEAPSCMQRFSQYTNCCFKLFGRSVQSNNTDDTAAASLVTTKSK